MRIAGLFLCCVVAASGCKNKDGGGGNSAPDPAALKAQEALIAKRNQMQDEYKDLVEKGEKLDLQISDVSAKGGDTTELKKQREQIDSQIAEKKGSIESQSGEIDKMGQALSNKLDDAGRIAMRERDIAERERRLADREHDFNDQVMKFAQVQKDSAAAWQATCQAGGQTIIQQVAPPKGGNYSRKEVDNLMARAKGAMAKKGLVGSDLGPQASLEGEVTKAMNDEDWGRAGVLANQYAATVDAIQVNRLFIQGKIARLQARAKANKLDDATNAQLASAMNEISKYYGDGDFANANRRINQVASVIK